MQSVAREFDALGLAAPQIGIHQRIILLTLQNGREKVFVNPQIVGKSTKVVPSIEGCLSVPALVASVPRHESIRLKAFDYSNGEEILQDFQGDDSFCLQHEIDHLDGVLFLDRVEDKEAIGVSNFLRIRAGERKIVDELVQQSEKLPQTIALTSVISFFLALSISAATN
ncbi:Oidioi.mRNA.OKI2018_I69.chr1.g3317.t1.cds [Oikopleura dioica]|uniref:Peptide deformylase n=1 Tax=Oikopleura dioica TaxID=34765 RepID=A0ABN7T093_OIKDI|nr:Oidioi.mRNA.OKI2018_I69.chr1.g3317.t1.cds [Oikopleura dioica]